MKKIIRTLGIAVVVALAVTSCTSKDEPATTTEPVGTVDPQTGNTVYTLDWGSLDNTSWKYVSATVPVAIDWDANGISNTDLLKEKANNCQWDDTITFGNRQLGEVTVNDLGVSCNNSFTWKYTFTPAGKTGGVVIYAKGTSVEYGSYPEVTMYKNPAGKTFLSLKGLDPTGKQTMTLVWEKI